MSYRLLRPFQASRKLGFAASFVLFILFSCAEKDSNKYDTGEANLRILAMYSLRDAECGTTHQLTGLLFSKADRTSVDLCTGELYMMDCAAWRASDPASAACKAIGVSFR